jgi:N-acyl homoserine lactone hydrolase
VALSTLPQIDRLVLATITMVPEWHPERDSFEPFPVHAWLIRHPDGAILVDTGVGRGNDLIDQWYTPHTISLREALRGVGCAPPAISAIVVSHLHFDHCGQLGTLTAPVYVQAAEFEAAQTTAYTVPEWAAIPPDRLRLVHGDEEIAAGVSLVFTPGHSPGHQSVLVDSNEGRIVLAAQCAFRAAELRTGKPASSNSHSDAFSDAAEKSLARILAMAPITVHLSHDPEVVIID